MYNLDIVITSSSRPQLYPYMWKSFNEMVIFRGKKRVLCHEDFVFPDQSKKVIKWLEKLKSKNEIHEIYSNSPAISLGKSLSEMINKVKTKYMFYIQEDWEFERPIDVDQILWVMDKNTNINCIYFNKIKNSGVINKCEQREYKFNGLHVCLSHFWAFLPGIWRTDFVRKHWITTTDHPEAFFTNRFGDHDARRNVEYCYKKMGAFIYGHQGDYRYVRHLGNDWRMAVWRREGGKPGGRSDPDMDLPYMADWIKSYYKERPQFKKEDGMTQKWKNDPSLHSCDTEKVDGQVKKKLDYEKVYVKEFLDADPLKDWESFEGCKNLWNWCMGALTNPDISKWNVLDCGTKDGQFPMWLQYKVEHAIGIEISEPYVKYAQEKNRPVQYGDVCKLGFVDEHFDFVFSHYLLGLTPDFRKGLSEMYRVTKKGCCMVALDNIPGNKRKHYSYVDSMDTIKEWLQGVDFKGHEIMFFDRNPYNKESQNEVILLLKKGE